VIFDSRACQLGEGPLWHPIREQLFWFDITARRLLTRKGENAQEWHFSEMVSAAGWTGPDGLFIASETGLFQLDLDSGSRTPVCPLEAHNPVTRSNDGRADPQGGFWIGTMGKNEEPGAGAIYRWYRGELRRLYPRISIPNAISFTPDGRTAHFADTVTGQVMRVALDVDGWPRGQPETYLDLQAEGLNPDGSVVDAEGRLWLAEWGAARVAAYAPDGTRVMTVAFAAPHTSCPAFGGTTLYCTTALHHMTGTARARHPDAGCTFAATNVAQGQSEHMVIL
jgi:sugar lactone lactonase YvrE